ncbi:Bug family tripartite tricarboxylate transporter substrate binding protein [Bordetella petrii]|uniref:Tripartite tricarboxylate transporter substrate-binding protein n=1 Tax=Bordetella petrii TaxID=94624 RepID=A0ABT7W6Q6_9BORD|nr:tripartite tricarboxylate transporter substrate-binding protein [Bordetella petrii]MDM9560861.1 tripartite tricarboxylate transporter substrate-binding protein [Bordetella petrii]
MNNDFARRACSVLLGLLAGMGAAQASGMPACQGGGLRMVVPAAPGGTTDLVARLIADHLARRSGFPVVVENRAGGGGTIGAANVARAQADGCTVLMGNIGSNAINYALNKTLSYGPRDFAPVTQVFAVPNVLVVNPAVSATDVQSLIRLAKDRPGKLALANSGLGQSTHMTGELFRIRTGIDVITVPYKGNAPAVADLLAGQVHMMFDNVAVSQPHIQAGKLRALAVTSTRRVSALPDVPTMAEAGMEGFDVVAWFGLFYPAHTPPAHVRWLQSEIAGILQQDAVQQQIAEWGGEVGGELPDAFQRYVDKEVAQWQSVVDQAGITLQ